MTTPAALSARRSSGGRIHGLDLARAVAIIGMVMVHFGPFEPDTTTLVGWAYRSSHGRASVLFVLLAGVGVTLLFDGAGGAPPRARDTNRAWMRVLWRAVVFIPVGLALQMLDTPVAVILQYYGAYYLIGAAASRLPTGWLVVLTGTWMVAGPALYVTFFDPDFAGRGLGDVWDTGEVVRDILLTGYYPAITWMPPVLVGVLIGRSDLRDTATRWALAVGGAVVAAAAYGTSEVARALSDAAADSPYLLAEGHTGAPLNVLGATGVAVAILGACLLLASALPRLTWPLVAFGQMALTVYVGHLLLLHAVPELLEARDHVGEAAVRVAIFTALTALTCTLWRTRFRRGPLEALLALPFTTRHRAQGPSTPTSTALPPPTPPHRSALWPDPNETSPDRSSAESSTPAPRPSPPSTTTSTSSSGTPPPRH